MTLALTAPARTRLVNGSPAVLATVITIVGALIVGVAALGQWCTIYTRNWREAAESSEALAKSLQEQLEEVRRAREELERRLATAEKQHSDDITLMEVRMAAWEAQVADAQRVIHHLNTKLDQSEARHAAIDARAEARNLRQHPEKP